jgi:hypothetical protein
MLSLLVLAAAAVPPSNVVPPIVGGLAGCWRAPGQVRGKDATSVARGSWHLGRRYFMLQLRSVVPKSPYEAEIVYGGGEKRGGVGSFWMDSFGGAYGPSLGTGAVTRDGFSLDYRFPDSVYTNRFTRNGKGWRWMIMEKATGKPAKLFARYDLKPASCRGISFDF